MSRVVTRDGGGRAPMRLAIIGWGAIARRFEALLRARNPGAVVVVCVCLRAGKETPHDLPDGALVVRDPALLAGMAPDLVVEAAGRASVAQWGEAALSAARGFVVLSTSAFVDNTLLERLIETARAQGSQVLVSQGALAGVDGLAAAATLPLTDVAHDIVKPPEAWRGTAAEKGVALDSLTSPAIFFEGSAREAAQAYPQNANVAVISARAGLGLDATRVRLIADPAATGNRHRIHAEGAFGRLDVEIENRPLADNPKSSEMTALGLVRLVENRFRPLAC